MKILIEGVIDLLSECKIVALLCCTVPELKQNQKH